jgi:hypothetical protein
MSGGFPDVGYSRDVLKPGLEQHETWGTPA